MATKLITLQNLTEYDAKIKELISTEDAKALKTVLYDATASQIKFYKKENATLSDTADYSIAIPSDLDGSAVIATVSEGVVTLKAGVTEDDGVISNSSGADITLAKVATTGAGEDVSYDNTTSGLTATDVQAAIDEVASQSAGGVDSKSVYITQTPGSSSDPFSKRYSIYQGATGSSASPVAGEKLVDIDLAKDMVVTSGSVGTVTTADVPYEGAVVGDKYIDLVIANATSDHIYIPANKLVDIYTAQQNATQIQLVIDNNNEISATIVAGSVTSTELATDAVITAKIADGNVTKGKLAQSVQDSLDLADSAIQSVAEGSTNGTVAVDGTDVAVHGLGSAAYTASSAYDAAGTAQAAIEALDSSTSDAGVTGTSGSALGAITGFTFTDGKVSAYNYTTLGSAATHADTDFMASADYTLTTNSEIEALFD